MLLKAYHRTAVPYVRLASDPAPLARKEGLVLIVCACAPFNESLELATLSVNFPSIYEVASPISEDFDKTEVRLGSS